MRWRVPEVVQTSELDCGPAALAAICGGYGLRLDPGRLREACQTSVSGTSIDQLEDVALALGARAQQVIAPVDHLWAPGSPHLPGIVVTEEPGGALHFLVIWRAHRWLGRTILQVMDPAYGRRWMTPAQLDAKIYRHSAQLPLSAWRSWAEGAPARAILGAQIAEVGGDPAWVGEALADPGWRSLAALDAATRLCRALKAGGMTRAESGALLRALWEEAAQDDPGPDAAVPGTWWCTTPGEDGGGEGEGAESVTFRGAVLLSVAGVGERPAELPEALRVARDVPEPRPLAMAWGMLPEGRWRWGLAALVAAAGLAEGAEWLLLQGGLAEPRLMLVPVAAGLILMVLEAAGAAGSRWAGRRLELSLWARFLEKIPRLGDRWFHSRLITDMADRGRGVAAARGLPEVGRAALGALVRLIVAAGLLGWLDPGLWWALLVIAPLCALLPLAAIPLLQERDLRLRSHSAAAGRFLLDAMLGAAPIRAHGAEGALRAEQERLLIGWREAGRSLVGAAAGVEAGVGLAAGLGGAALVGLHLSDPARPASLLALYLALQVPAAAGDLSRTLAMLPAVRGPLLRAMEPLGAPDLAAGLEPSQPISAGLEAGQAKPDLRGPSIRLRGVSVVASGQALLSGIDLDLQPGEHVAIVGPSGAGKSTLLGLLLGWHLPAAGAVEVDGAPLDGAGLARLRRCTAWVDPAIHLRRGSVASNLAYGSPLTNLPLALEGADLRSALDRMPRGLRTEVGEGGACLSGGEGQRLRLGRALMREGVRLALLDEPLRGLDRARRDGLLDRARARWRDQTLLCVTHDLDAAKRFPRVIVVDGGQIVEDGRPSDLLARRGRYRALLLAEQRLSSELWGDEQWRRITMRDGQIVEGA